jgi:hypothetical protein
MAALTTGMTRSDTGTRPLREATGADSGQPPHREHPLLPALVRLTRACDSALTILDQPDGRGSDTTIVRVLSRCRTVAAKSCGALGHDQLPSDAFLDLLAHAAAAKALLRQAANPQLERQASDCEAAFDDLRAATAAMPAAPVQ